MSTYRPFYSAFLVVVRHAVRHEIICRRTIMKKNCFILFQMECWNTYKIQKPTDDLFK